MGGQGAGKSSFFRLLAVNDDWFSDDLKKLDDENVYRKMQGHWIIELIILYYYQELSMKEIAQVIGKSENVTIQRVNRARKKLKKILMEVGYGL